MARVLVRGVSRQVSDSIGFSLALTNLFLISYVWCCPVGNDGVLREGTFQFGMVYYFFPVFVYNFFYPLGFVTIVGAEY